MELATTKRALSYLRMMVDPRFASPVYLVIFVKGTCHAKCLHCFLPSLEEHHTASRELTVPEIQKLSRNLGPNIYSVLLAGGEPFMRKDLGDILEALSNNRQLKAIKVVTNGFFTERTVSTWERILQLNKKKYYGVTISFDGLKELHEYIRGVKAIFDRAVETFRQLKSLSQRYGNFEVDVNVTVSHFNQDHLAPLYDYLRDSLRTENVICTVTRGAPRDTLAKDVQLSKYQQFSNTLSHDLACGRLKGHDRFLMSDTLNAINVVQRGRIARMLETGKYISPCNAGRLSAVIGSDGKVYACELLNDVLGDLRENNYDLLEIWNSKAARQLRSGIRGTNCFCTYENANLLNVLFNPRYFPQVIAKSLSMKLGRRFGKRPPERPTSITGPNLGPATPKSSSRSLDHLILR